MDLPLTPVTTVPQISSTSRVNYTVLTTPGNYTLEFFASTRERNFTDRVVVTWYAD
ncbi:MAG: hypothetical protein IPK85_03235 [Gemmatimonadetes bacterium]|nr:hypothetical protein [Gemmatimonadota bacterium]